MKNKVKADIFASVIFVSTKDEIKKIMKENKKIKAMVINKDLNQEFYNGFQEIIV
jgi:thiamine biosynthesis lipoprotein ApbE